MNARLASVTGFAVLFLLLVLVFAAQLANALRPIGWEGTEYLVTFFFVALGAALIGPVVKVAAPRWRTAANGMTLAGVIGLVLFAALMGLIYWGLGG
ncbi:hypothetical protein SAMN04488564_101840 [Lentzea waywayandensis]|uniref:Uncharacterized protein n=1 Tax=Lentzea waywayandensis TaxID=84724 RepID=A0A1I6D1J2_9PSEU|nr:hypothetical protein [Lentzea waywayandensis]SFQ99366.1 hypothetical protein SAMN04488564_101840 [Lentzea waywayandensis]